VDVRESSDDARRTVLSRGGMAVDGYCRCRDAFAGVAKNRGCQARAGIAARSNRFGWLPLPCTTTPHISNLQAEILFSSLHKHVIHSLLDDLPAHLTIDDLEIRSK
jgi:hypothetical protein